MATGSFEASRSFTANEPVSPIANCSADDDESALIEGNAFADPSKDNAASTIVGTKAAKASNSASSRTLRKNAFKNFAVDGTKRKKVDVVDKELEEDAETADAITRTPDESTTLTTMTKTTTTIATMSTRRLLLNHKLISSSSASRRNGLRDKLVSLKVGALRRRHVANEVAKNHFYSCHR